MCPIHGDNETTPECPDCRPYKVMKPSKIRPSRGYVLIEATEADEVSAGGVYLPDRVKDMPQKGKVLAVGEEITNCAECLYGKKYPTPHDSVVAIRSHILGTNCGFFDPPCKVGDIVIFKKFVDNRIKEEGKELLLVPFSDILGVYEEK